MLSAINSVKYATTRLGALNINSDPKAKGGAKYSIDFYQKGASNQPKGWQADGIYLNGNKKIGTDQVIGAFAARFPEDRLGVIQELPDAIRAVSNRIYDAKKATATEKIQDGFQDIPIEELKILDELNGFNIQAAHQIRPEMFQGNQPAHSVHSGEIPPQGLLTPPFIMIIGRSQPVISGLPANTLPN